MTATDDLRRMLTESGVEWDYGITGTASTMFNANGVELTFVGMRDGVTCSTILTPAQAVAATIGRGTCEANDIRQLFDKTPKTRRILRVLGTGVRVQRMR